MSVLQAGIKTRVRGETVAMSLLESSDRRISLAPPKNKFAVWRPLAIMELHHLDLGAAFNLTTETVILGPTERNAPVLRNNSGDELELIDYVRVLESNMRNQDVSSHLKTNIFNAFWRDYVRCVKQMC